MRAVFVLEGTKATVVHPGPDLDAVIGGTSVAAMEPHHALQRVRDRRLAIVAGEREDLIVALARAHRAQTRRAAMIRGRRPADDAGSREDRAVKRARRRGARRRADPGGRRGGRMNPPVAVAGLLARGLPWAAIGVAGALVGAAAVRGARFAAAPPAIAGAPDEDEVDDACPPGAGTVIGPVELMTGGVAGRVLALVLRPRPLGAFLGGLAAGALTAAFVPAEGAFPSTAGELR